jgi:tetratricopeptide (TPR) repeat protein
MLITTLLIVVILLGAFYYYITAIRPKLRPAYRAEMFEKQNMLPEAAIEYRKILDDCPDDFTAHFRLGDIYLRLNETDNAINHFEEVMRLGKFNFAVDRVDVQKKLANAYYMRDEIEKVFGSYLDVLNASPSDPEALYHVAFIALGQEEFEMAQRYFEKLVKVNRDDFSVFFGAGICSYQNQKVSDAVNNFQAALTVNPRSDAGNLAMAMGLFRKKDFKQSLVYANEIVTSTKDPAVLFIGKRLMAFINLQLKKNEEALKIFEEINTNAKSNESQDDIMMSLFDLGYAYIRSDKLSQAYAYWNELYQIDKTYNNIQRLVTVLRKEMDAEAKKKRDEFEVSILDGIDDWALAPFPQNFLWEVCGLKAKTRFDIKNVLVSTRIFVQREGDADSKAGLSDSGDRLQRFMELDAENFRIASNRVLAKMGYKVDQILQTYREPDGVDFMANSIETKEKTLVWVRRWKKTQVGEIPLRNFAQAINDNKLRQGIFVTAGELTEGAKGSLDKLGKVMIIYPEQLNEFLRGII